MSPIGISSLVGGVESILGTVLQKVGLTSNAASAPTVAQPDTSQLSPLGRVLSTLQQLQQSNPTQYKQLAQQIAANLQTAAKTAFSKGNTAEALQLNRLHADFANASASGQLPDTQGLAQAAAGPVSIIGSTLKLKV